MRENPIVTPEMCDSLKVFFVHHSGNCGGAEFSLLDLVERLDASGIATTAILPGSGKLSRLFEEKGITVIRLPINALKRSLNPLKLLACFYRLISVNLRLRKLIREHKPDIVHANSAMACLYTFAACARTKTPLVWHERDLMRHRIIYRLISRFCARIIVTSNSVRDNLAAQIGCDTKLDLVSNGIDPDRFSLSSPVQSRADLGLPEGGRLVLCVAQFVGWKRHDFFLDAAETVAKRVKNVYFLLAADDSMPDEQAYLSKLKERVAGSDIRDQVIFTGFVGDIPALLGHCDCVVLPSHREPFGRILIEGMAAGKPVIAIKACGPGEIITHEENGLLVAPGKTFDMSEAIIKVLENPELAARLGRNGMTHVHNKYTIERTSARMKEIFGKLKK